MTAVPLLVRPIGIVDVSRPASAGGWQTIAGVLTDVGLVLLTVLALPALLAVVLASIELLARASIAIAGRAF